MRTKAEEAVLMEAFGELLKAAEKWSALMSTIQTSGHQAGRLHLSNGWVLDLHPACDDSAIDLGEAHLLSYSDRDSDVRVRGEGRNIEATFATPYFEHLTVKLPEAAKGVQKFFYDILSEAVEKRKNPRFRLQAIKMLP